MISNPIAHGDVVSFTGHRPDKLGGYGPRERFRLQRFAVHVIDSQDVRSAVVGMALGFDMAIAQACAERRVPFVAAVPFLGQERLWQKPDRDEYEWLLKRAERVEIVGGNNFGYGKHKFGRRNKWMVDNSTRTVALWDGSPGGTGNCVRYALQCDRIVTNVWGQWEAFR